MLRLTIVIPTYNRAPLLARALRRVSAQTAGAVPIDIVVVDNNSTDETTRVVDECGDPRVRLVFEPQQGLSFARNAGIAAAAARREKADDHIIAFTDDDVEVADGWAERLLQEFVAHPEIDCVGGRVLPEWEVAPPRWLTTEHWGPLALQDHGEDAREFNRHVPICLVGANVAFRRRVFDRVGWFSPAVQRVKVGIGSTEDHELLLRMYDAGGRARYAPDVVVTTPVPQERMTRAYHRRWHEGHGRFTAVMRVPEMELSSRGSLMGVPAHLFRSAATDAAAWLRWLVTGDAARAFAAETRLWFFSGFLKERTWLARR